MMEVLSPSPSILSNVTNHCFIIMTTLYSVPDDISIFYIQFSCKLQQNRVILGPLGLQVCV